MTAELTRINQDLYGAGVPWIRRVANADGGFVLQEYKFQAQPSGWQEHNDARRATRAKTFAIIHELGRTRCSQVSTAQMRKLMTTMTAEGLSDSTIQKEVALLKHLFNMACQGVELEGVREP